MPKFISYLWWTVEIVLIHAILGFTWALSFAIVCLAIEFIYFLINKFFGQLIRSCGAPWLRALVYQIRDYKNFWYNYIIRIVMFTLGLYLGTTLFKGGI